MCTITILVTDGEELVVIEARSNESTSFRLDVASVVSEFSVGETGL